MIIPAALCVLLSCDPLVDTAFPPLDREFSITSLKSLRKRLPPALRWSDRSAPASFECTAFAYPHGLREVAQISCPYDSLTCDSRVKGVRELHIPPVKKGEVLPIFGGLYEATADSTEGFKFQWVTPSEYPPGLRTVQRRSVTILLESAPSCGTTFHAPTDWRSDALTSRRSDGPGFSMYLTEVNKRVRNGKVDYVACLAHYGWVEKEKGPPPVQVARGDILILPEPVAAGVQVLDVVPKDEKAKTIGWIELGFDTIPLDQVKELAKAEGRNVVTFELPDRW